MSSALEAGKSFFKKITEVNPLPVNLHKEVKMALKILESNEEAGTIPTWVLQKCKGVAIMCVNQTALLLGGAKGGSGIVLAKAGKGWSYPVAIGTAGLTMGLQVGFQSVQVVMLLMTDSAVKAFTQENFTLGGALGVAAGPKGRSAEADLAVKSTAAVLTYAYSRGLYLGMGLEGMGLFQRPDTNKEFFNRPVSPIKVLEGKDDVKGVNSEGVELVEELHRALEDRCQGRAPPARHSPTADNARASTERDPEMNPPKSPVNRSGSDRFAPAQAVVGTNHGMIRTPVTGKNKVKFTARALYDFDKAEETDLAFRTGDLIEVYEDTGEWWVGFNTRTYKKGNFPYNYVEQVSYK